MAEPHEAHVEEPKDYTKLIWLGIGGLFVVMVLAIWALGRPTGNVSNVQARHILITFDSNDASDRIRALDLASELRDRLDSGESFEKLAREYSDDPQSSVRGGVLPWAEPGTYVPAFEEFVWSAEIGELSEVIETDFGFHIIEVLERHITDARRSEMELERRARELREQGGAITPDLLLGEGEDAAGEEAAPAEGETE